MKIYRKYLFIIIFLLSNITFAQDTLNILFIGNSITYYNNMPQTFEKISNSLNHPVKVTLYAPGGTGIVDHYRDPNVYNHIKQAKWDYFILQPGSNESPGYSYPIDVTLYRVDTILDSLYTYNPCVELLYFQIPYGVLGSSQSNLDSYNETMDLILNNNKYLADSTKSFFAPVGEAFRASWNKDTTNMLWTGYLSVHPNAKGSYIAACIFFASIFQEESRGTTITGGLSAETADSCQILADSIVLNNLAEWRINTYNQELDFSYTIINDSVYFQSLSTNYDSLLWDFGDGNFSNLTNPVHYYQNNGDFQITLYTYKHNCAKSINKNIIYLNNNIVAKTNKIKIYPNPANDFVIIENTEKKINKITVYDISGRAIKQIFLNNNKTVVNISELQTGVYYLKAENKINKILKK